MEGEAPQAATWRLWVARKDTPDAQYSAVRGVAPDLSVDEFKARWLSDERLDISKALLTLRLVKRGSTKPTKAEDDAALADSSALLDDPSLALATAGVGDGSWLLAVFDAALLPRPAVKLEALLAPRLAVQPAVIHRIYERFASRANAAVERRDAEMALQLYHDALALPSRTTCVHFSDQGYALNGPLYEGSRLVVCFKGLAVHVLKGVDGEEYERMRALEDAARSSTPCTHIVPFELREERSKFFVIMPKLCSTLEFIPHGLALQHAMLLLTQMRAALDYLHALGFAHCDIKPANVGLRDDAHTFVLIDLGSASPFGTRARYTPAYVPQDMLQVQPAVLSSAALDWWMLGTTLAEKACKAGMSYSPDDASKSKTRAELGDFLATALPEELWAAYWFSLRAADGKAHEFVAQVHQPKLLQERLSERTREKTVV